MYLVIKAIVSVLALCCLAFICTLIALGIEGGEWSFWYIAAVPILILLFIFGADQIEPAYFKLMESDIFD